MGIPRALHRHEQPPPAVHLNVFHQHMDRLAREQHALTMRTLTAGMPVYQVTYVQTGSDEDGAANHSAGWLRLMAAVLLAFTLLLFAVGAYMKCVRARRLAASHHFTLCLLLPFAGFVW